MGTGAFESAEAERKATMKVKGDENSYVQITSINDEHGSIGGSNGRTWRLQLRKLNDDAITKFGPLLNLRTAGSPNLTNDYKYWMTLNPGNNASGLNEDSEGNQVVRFEWDDDGNWKPLNTKNNAQPADMPELGPGESVDVRLTIDLRNFEPDSDVSNGESYKLLKQVIIHAEEVQSQS